MEPSARIGGRPVPSTAIRVGGVHVRVAGRGRTILLLHGIGSSSDAFAPQLRDLADTYRLLAWDAPGYADSDDPSTAPGMDGYADTAAEVVAALAGGAVDVVGVSMGGVIATRLALRHPELVRSLVLADSLVGSGARDASATAMRRRVAELAEHGPRAFAERRAARLTSADPPPGLVTQLARSMAASIRLPGYGFAAEAMADTDHTSQLSRVAAPTLVLVGSEDRVTPLERSQELVAGIPDARLQVLRGAGHCSNQERPEDFTRAVRAFLARIPETDCPSVVPWAAAPMPPTPTSDGRCRSNPQSQERMMSASATTDTADLDQLLDSCIATRGSRHEDWDTLAFQAKAGEEFRRAQIRYIGSGATGDHDGDDRILPAEHFTFSNMKLPPGGVGPEHTHHDVEEVFFVLEGQLEVAVHDVEDGTRTASRVLGYRDLVRVPAGVPRSLKNVGDTDALFCVVIGANKPQLPTYPATSPVAGVTRD